MVGVLMESGGGGDGGTGDGIDSGGGGGRIVLELSCIDIQFVPLPDSVMAVG